MILGMQSWIFWLILVAVFACIEIATVNLVSIWFAGGSLAAMIAAFCGADVTLQILIAVGVSGVLLALMVIFKPFGSLRNRPQQPTNSDRVIGKEAIVLTEIDPCEGTGTVKVLGQIWSAVSDDDGVIAAGERVTVCAITGVKLVVMKFTKGE